MTGSQRAVRIPEVGSGADGRLGQGQKSLELPSGNDTANSCKKIPMTPYRSSSKRSSMIVAKEKMASCEKKDAGEIPMCLLCCVIEMFQKSGRLSELHFTLSENLNHCSNASEPKTQLDLAVRLG